MKNNPKLIKIDDIEYVQKDTYQKAKQLDCLDFVVVRTYSAGVFAGYLEERNGKEVKLLQAIRLWYWKGAFTLSQLAMEGVNEPQSCNFAMPVEKIILTEAIEIIECSEQAKSNILSVKPTKK